MLAVADYLYEVLAQEVLRVKKQQLCTNFVPPVSRVCVIWSSVPAMSSSPRHWTSPFSTPSKLSCFDRSRHIRVWNVAIAI